eukprot:scaffold24398_cov133-Isochrysis_galbana.AAC.2
MRAVRLARLDRSLDIAVPSPFFGRRQGAGVYRGIGALRVDRDGGLANIYRGASVLLLRPQNGSPSARRRLRFSAASHVHLARAGAAAHCISALECCKRGLR